MHVVSVEANNRLHLSYDANIPEKRSWNFNIYFGWKHLSAGNKRNMGFYLRYYTGIIPNGQFRNSDGFRYMALSVAYN
jgi:hypothetical protein